MRALRQDVAAVVGQPYRSRVMRSQMDSDRKLTGPDMTRLTGGEQLTRGVVDNSRARTKMLVPGRVRWMKLDCRCDPGCWLRGAQVHV